MDNILRAAPGPIIEIVVINDLRARARSLSYALVPYTDTTGEAVPGELRDQVYALAHEANRLIAQAIDPRQGGRWYNALVLTRNYYRYHRQAYWTGSDDETLYVTYDSCLHGEVCELIWEPYDWVCWSPPWGVKRDFVTFLGAPAIVHELANGDILDDMAGLPLSKDEARIVRRKRLADGYREDGRNREDTFPGHAGHDDGEEFFEMNPKWSVREWEDAHERAHQEWLENLQMLPYEPEQRVRNDVYLD